MEVRTGSEIMKKKTHLIRIVEDGIFCPSIETHYQGIAVNIIIQNNVDNKIWSGKSNSVINLSIGSLRKCIYIRT